jgi:cell shape-determining protein MreC
MPDKIKNLEEVKQPEQEEALEGDEENSSNNDLGEVSFPSDEEMDSQIEEAGAAARVSFMDPDFSIFLFLAIIVDIISIFLALLAVSVVTELIQIIMSLLAALVFGFWMKSRMDKIQESKEARRQEILKSIEKQKAKLAKYQKMGKLSPEAYDRYMQRYGKQMGKQGKFAAKILVKSPAGKILLRVGLSFLGKVSVILAFIPMWTISVVLMLREK